MNEEITTEVIGMIEKEGWQYHARRIHGTNGLAPAQNAHSGGNLETKIVEPIKENDDFTARTIKAQYANTSAANLTRLDALGATGAKTEIDGQFRIRKLTPRECFRLMGCDEQTIDKLLNAGISQSQLYKLAGNSIVVDVLYHIFRKMFVEKGNEDKQLSIFDYI